MEKQDLTKRADEFFKENVGADRVYFTSDGNMFRAERYAKNWAGFLTDKTISPIFKNGEQSDPIVTDGAGDGAGAGGETGGASGAGDGGSGDEREELVKRYIELFDTKPNHMTGIPKLKEKIAEKEAAIQAEADKA